MLQDPDLQKMQENLRQPEPIKKKKNNKVGLLILLVLLLVIGGITGFFFLSKNKKSVKKDEDKVKIVERVKEISEDEVEDEGLVLLKEIFNDKWDRSVDDLEKESFVDGNDQIINGETNYYNEYNSRGREEWYRYKDYLIYFDVDTSTSRTMIKIYDNDKNTLKAVDLVYSSFMVNGNDDKINCPPIIKDGKLYYMKAESQDNASPSYLEYIDLRNDLKVIRVKEYNLEHILN